MADQIIKIVRHKRFTVGHQRSVKRARLILGTRLPFFSWTCKENYRSPAHFHKLGALTSTFP
jgi:hypothetical protein